MQPIKWEMPNRGVIMRVALAAGLFASFLNAYSESMEYRYALLFMFSHYALFIAGFALSYRSVAFPKWVVIPASFLAVYWHLPAPLALSAAIQTYRLLEETSLILSGLLMGGCIRYFSPKIKLALFGIWIAADSALSIVFIVAPGVYSSSGIPLSPYPPFQFVMLGIAMVFFMNGIIALVVYLQMKRIGKSLAAGGG